MRICNLSFYYDNGKVNYSLTFTSFWLAPNPFSTATHFTLEWQFSVFSWQDSPDQGALYLVRGLLNVVQEYTWELNGDSKMSVYLNAICLLSAMSQVCSVCTTPKKC